MYVQITVHIKAVVQVKSYIYVCSVVIIERGGCERSLSVSRKTVHCSSQTAHRTYARTRRFTGTMCIYITDTRYMD